MPALLESADRPLSLNDAAAISPRLAADLSRLTLRTEGFSVEDYLSLDGPYLVEYVGGRIQVLPMPDVLHQELVLFILLHLRAWLDAADVDARTTFSPFFVKLSEQQYREPDVCVMLGKHRDRRARKLWHGADVVVEVVSESNRLHDLVTKRREYAQHGIPEYWIVDPTNRTVTVLTLVRGTYAEAGVFAAGGATLASPLLPGFTLDVAAMFDEATRRAE